MMVADRVKVKRDGPRGWHWIARANYDPSKHELVEQAEEAKQQPQQAETVKRGPGRPRKNPQT